MTAENRPLKRERLGEPVEFPAPPPEVMARLRALLPPVPRSEPMRRAS
jgi:hypothetical protein